MKRFENVLFVADPDADNTPALAEALALCRRNGAALTMTVVVPDTVIGITAMVQAAMLENSTEWLDELTRGADVGQVPVRRTVHCGRPFIEVIHEVLNAGHDLVIKPAQPTSGLSGRMFAATDRKLLRKCPCPVWLIRSAEQRGPREVLVALDFDPANPENAPLNHELLDIAMSLCVAEFAELHIVHAWRLEHEGFLRSPRMGLDREDVDRMVDREEAHRRQGLASLIDERSAAQGDKVSEFLKPTLHMIRGRAQDVIPALAEKMQVELVIMGTVARTGVPGLVIGNTAETILNDLDCSVVAVKPAGFISPVALGDRAGGDGG